MARDWWRGSVLSEARKRAGLTQAALAKEAGVHKITISRIERGDRHPSMALLQRLAKVLNVSTDELKKGRGAPMSSSGVVFDSGLVKDEKVTPELLVWLTLRERRSGGTPAEVVADLEHRGFARGNREAIEQRVGEMLEMMTSWSAHRRVQKLSGGRYRAFLERQ